MATSSTAAGYLSPESSPVYGDGLDDILQAAIVGITGLAGSLVRPRWQPEPATPPPFTTDWVAFGVVRASVDAFAYEDHDSAGLGTTNVDRDEVLQVLHSFYGPNSHGFCERFRDGLNLEQNRAVLQAAGVLLTEVEEATILPALLKEKWVRRVDVNVVYRRRTSRPYTIRNIVTGQFGLDNEIYVTPIIVPTP